MTKTCSDIYKMYKVECEVIIKKKYIGLLNRKFINIRANEKDTFIKDLKTAIEKAKNCRDLRIKHSRECWADIDYGHIAEIARAKHFIKLYEMRLHQLGLKDKTAINRYEEIIQNSLITAKKINRDIFTMNIPIPPTPSKNNQILPTPTPKTLLKRFSIADLTFKPKSSEQSQVNKIINAAVDIELKKLNPLANSFVPK